MTMAIEFFTESQQQFKNALKHVTLIQNVRLLGLQVLKINILMEKWIAKGSTQLTLPLNHILDGLI